MSASQTLSTQLRITEIFYSLQGEARTVGLPTTFVRLTGCPLRCVYCDTEYAFTGGTMQSIASIADEVKSTGTKYVTVTGGEPLAQKECGVLLTKLCDDGFEVSLETSGAISIEGLDPRVSVVMDLKTPASEESHRNLWDNIKHLQPNDQLKFVVCNKADYDWAKFKIDELNLTSKVDDVLMSPSFGQVSPAELAGWILADKLAVRMQIQMHKLLWGEEQGR
ncbi:MAG: 7-carboxy-7-deazaguanine synthase [Porticoccus sp.]|jgi:7-carboxy-7-deazaguanine synthase